VAYFEGLNKITKRDQESWKRYRCSSWGRH